MKVFLALLTYFAYLFIVVAYAWKAKKYFTLPIHIRWELYPVMHEEHADYGGSYYENMDWWEKKQRKRRFRSILFLLKEYLYLSEYMKRHRSYWFVLYPWHIGFILIIKFHILCFFGALVLLWGVPIDADSPAVIGVVFYYLILLTGLISFVFGAFGSLGLIIKRTTDQNLRAYAVLLNYVSYVFTFIVFLSGLYAWYFDPTMAEYREFWRGLVTLHFIHPEPATIVHIVLFDLFLIYLPFTRSMHYITRLFAFFLIRWDDEPNRRGGKIEKQLEGLFQQKVSWSGPHIGAGRTWGEIAKDEKK
jgi:nitrate reductase gamma subunit